MRKLLTLALFAFTFFDTYATVTIRGRILNYDGKTSVYYQPTLEGIFAPYYKELKPDPSGAFVIKFENPGIGTMLLSYKDFIYRLLYDGNSEIYIECDESKLGKYNPMLKSNLSDLAYFSDSLKQVGTVKITGSFEDINRYYNRNPRSSMIWATSISGNFYSKQVYSASTPQRAVQIIDSLVRHEITQIDQLAGPVSENSVNSQYADIRKFLTQEVETFYSTIFLNGMWMKRRTQIEKLNNDPSASRDIYNEQWEKLIEELCRKNPPAKNPAVNSREYYDWIVMYQDAAANYKQYEFPAPSGKSRDEGIAIGLFKMDSVYKLPKKYHLAVTLPSVNNYLQKQTYYSPALLNNLYQLQSMYTESPHLKFFEPQIKKVEEFLKTADYEKASVLEVNGKSFTDILKQFEGKPLLLDVWATWCGPCIYEFQFKDRVNEYRDKQQLEVLYVSTDRLKDKDRWQKSINFNKLAGYHIFADSALQADIWKFLKTDQAGIPRYVLFNGKGKLVKAYMARPSNEKLFRQNIEAVLKKE